MKTLQVLIIFLCSFFIQAQEPEYVQVFFENSPMPQSWFHSKVTYQGRSYVLNRNEKLPVNAEHFFTPGNSLELTYTSAPGGSWEAWLEFPYWRGKDHFLKGSLIRFWMYIADHTKVEELPKISLVLKDSTASQAVAIGSYVPELKPRQWVQVRIPLAAFKNSRAFDMGASDQVRYLLLKQHTADGKEHQLLLDQVEIMPEGNPSEDLKNPKLHKITGYERHVDLEWENPANQNIRYVKIYRAEAEGEFVAVGIRDPKYFSRYTDYTGVPGRKYSYKIGLLDQDLRESPLSEPLSTETREMSDEELLDMVQRAHFRYYWEGAEPVSGLALENIPGRSNMIATGASGFGLMALIVGVERDFIERKEFLDRMEKILGFIEKGDRFQGALAHFMDGPTGRAEPFFGAVDNGGDLVETSFFMQGLLTVKQYLSEEVPAEKALRDRITAIWEAVEWDWYKQFENSNYLYWHWSPDHQ